MESNLLDSEVKDCWTGFRYPQLHQKHQMVYLSSGNYQTIPEGVSDGAEMVSTAIDNGA